MARLIILSLALGLILSSCTVDDPLAPELANVTQMDVPAIAESMSPNLAIGPDGTIVLSWLELHGPESSLKYSQLGDDGWAAARSVAHGGNWFVNWADFPSVVPISSNLWAAHWLVSQPEGGYAYDIAVALSSDSGESWSEPVMPHRDGTDTEHGFVTMYPDSAGIGLIWLDGRKMVNEVTDDVAASGMTLRAASLSPDMLLSAEMLVDGLICDCCQTDVAITSDGPVAIYRNRTIGEIRDIYVSRYEGNRWQQGFPVNDDNWEIPGCPVNGPVIGAHENTVAVAWFTAATGVPRVRAGLSSDAAKSFSAPIDIVSGETLGRVGLAVLSDSEVAVSWMRKLPGESAEVCVRRLSADGHLGPIKVISDDDIVAAFSVPQMIRKGGELILAWTRLDGDNSQVMSARVPIDSL